MYTYRQLINAVLWNKEEIALPYIFLTTMTRAHNHLFARRSFCAGSKSYKGRLPLAPISPPVYLGGCFAGPSLFQYAHPQRCSSLFLKTAIFFAPTLTPMDTLPSHATISDPLFWCNDFFYPPATLGGDSIITWMTRSRPATRPTRHRSHRVYPLATTNSSV